MRIRTLEDCLPHGVLPDFGSPVYRYGESDDPAKFVAWLYHPDGAKKGCVIEKLDGTWERMLIRHVGMMAEGIPEPEEPPVEMAECSECGDEFPKDEMTWVDDADGLLCDDCRCEHYCSCEDCGETIHNDNSYYVEHGDRYVCESCHDRNYSRCTHCEETYPDDNLRSINGEQVCEACRDNHYRSCDNCGEYVHEDDVNWDEDSERDLCESCYRENRSRVIHDYGYKPNPIFHDDRATGNSRAQEGVMYYGLELEMEVKRGCGRNRQTIAEAVHEPSKNNYYLKHDGSLNDGFEVVTHPRSRESWHRYFDVFDKEVLKKAQDMGMHAHDANTCGIHIHMSLDPWHPRQLPRLYKLMCHNSGIGATANEKEQRRDILCVSQRSSEKIDEWASLRLIDMDRAKDALARKQRPHDVNHYSGINITSTTIEFRIFNSSLRLDRVKKAFDFVYALFMYTQEDQVTWTGFKRWVQDNRADVPYLYDFWATKRVLPLPDPVVETMPEVFAGTVQQGTIQRQEVTECA